VRKPTEIKKHRLLNRTQQTFPVIIWSLQNLQNCLLVKLRISLRETSWNQDDKNNYNFSGLPLYEDETRQILIVRHEERLEQRLTQLQLGRKGIAVTNLKVFAVRRYLDVIKGRKGMFSRLLFRSIRTSQKSLTSSASRTLKNISLIDGRSSSRKLLSLNQSVRVTSSNWPRAPFEITWPRCFAASDTKHMQKADPHELSYANKTKVKSFFWEKIDISRFIIYKFLQFTVVEIHCWICASPNRRTVIWRQSTARRFLESSEKLELSIPDDMEKESLKTQFSRYVRNVLKRKTLTMQLAMQFTA